MKQTERKITNTDSYVALIKMTSIIAPNKDDVRKIDIDTLSNSIYAIGLINPITVVQDKNKCYRIIAGRRRYWACLKADIVEISCTVMQTDDTVANRVIEVTENLHRLQLTPMQEANAINKLRFLKMTDEAIAADLGMTEQFVARRVKLLDLSPTWQKALSGKSIKDNFSYTTTTLIPHWPVACLELIARYDHKRQDGMIIHLTDDVPTINELKTLLSRDEHKLLGVPWSLDDESLYPKAGSCDTCPKRSSVQPLLFDDGVASKKNIIADRCLDDMCFREKMKRHANIKLSAAKTKYPNAVLVRSGYYNGDGDQQEGLLAMHYTVAKKKTKGAKLALMLDGDNAGRTLYITTGKGVKAKSADAKKKPITDKDRAQRLRNRRNKWIIDYVRTELSKNKKDWPQLLISDLVAAVITCGLTLHDYKEHIAIQNVFPTFAKNQKLQSSKCCDLFWRNFRQDIARKLCVINTGILASEIMPTLPELFSMMGTTCKELWELSAKEIPDKHNYLKERPDKKPAKKKGKK